MRNSNWAAVVDPYSTGTCLPEKLKQKGFRVVRVQHGEKLHQLDAADIEACRGHVDAVVIHTDDIEATIARLRGFAPEMVIPGYEGVVDLAERLANGLGLRTNEPERIEARVNKYAMHQAVASRGVPVSKQKSFSDPGAALKWIGAQRVPYPLIVKPIHSAGTDGVSLCANVEEVRAAFASQAGKVNILKRENKELIVQEYIRGAEYVVDAMTIEGRHYITDMWRYEKKVLHGRHIVYDYAELLAMDDARMAPVVAYQRQVLDALGIRVGPTHGELFIADDGRILLGEVGARLPGGDLPKSLAMARGIDLAELFIGAYANPPETRSALEQMAGGGAHCRLVSLLTRQRGKIAKVRRELLAALPSLKLCQLPKAGDWLEPTVDLVTSPGHLALISESAESVESDYKAIRSIEPELFVVE